MLLIISIKALIMKIRGDEPLLFSFALRKLCKLYFPSYLYFGKNCDNINKLKKDNSSFYIFGGNL